MQLDKKGESQFDRVFKDGPKCVLSGVKSFNRIRGVQIAWFVQPENANGDLPHSNCGR